MGGLCLDNLVSYCLESFLSISKRRLQELCKAVRSIWE